MVWTISSASLMIVGASIPWNGGCLRPPGLQPRGRGEVEEGDSWSNAFCSQHVYR